MPSSSSDTRIGRLLSKEDCDATTMDLTCEPDETPTKKPKQTIIIPEEINPYSKAGQRKKTNQGKKPGNNKILTDTPEKKNY